MPDYSVPAPDDNTKGYAVPAPDDVDHPGYPDWYLKSSDLRKTGYNVTPPEPADPDAEILARRLGMKPDAIARLKTSQNYEPGMFSTGEKLFREGEPLGSALGSPPGRFVAGIADNPIGIAQAVQHMPWWSTPTGAALRLKAKLAGKGDWQSDKDLMDAVIALKAQYINENTDVPMDVPVVGDLPTVAGRSLFPFPAGKAVQGARTLGQVILGGAKAAAKQGAWAGAFTPVESGPDGDFASQKALQVAGGAGAGAVLGGTVTTGTTLAGRTRTPAPEVGNVRPEVFAGDIASRRQAAVASDLAELQGLIQKGKRPSDASEILSAYTKSQDDLGAVMQNSAELQRLRERIASDERFAKRDQLAAKAQTRSSETLSALDSVLNDIEAIKLKSPQTKTLASMLSEYRDNLAQDPLSFKSLTKDRAVIGEKIRSLYEGKPLGSEEAALVQRVKSAMDKDIQAGLMGAGPAAVAADVEARSGYRAYQEKWGKKAKVAGEISKEETPDILADKILRGESVDRVKLAKDALGAAGQEALREKVLRGMVDRANTAADGSTTHFQVNNLLTYIRKNRAQLAEVFDGVDATRLQGLEKILETAHEKSLKAGGALSGAIGGFYLGGPPGAAGGAALGAAAGGTGAVRGLKASERISSVIYDLLTTKSGQKMLLESASYKAKSPKMEALLQQLEAEFGKGASYGQRFAPPKPESERTY